MAEQTEQYDPADYNVEDVNEYLADADADERGRVLQAERDGKGRTGILEGPHNAAPTGDEPTGLAATGNPLDLATKPDAEVSANIAHQEGAPAALIEAADTAAELGYVAPDQTLKPEKPDYSQRNPEVMNGGGAS